MAGSVTVACKLPHGLILDLPGKGRVTIAGNAVPQGEVPAQQIVGAPSLGYALTPNIDEDFWNAWLEKYKDSDFVVRGFVFALPKSIDARAKAKEMEAEKTGLERINPDDPGDKLERFAA